ncbi:Hypothetical_protein [Hexamita inflata]|uniref:Hypothetical_protein n=1 Tax=Hexamita inflata TaxID=28002 RepID=A0AA86NST4_9EUKA|nr:Hypothetical protein HINF_LOCUS12441 [Hexamita inflata]
MPAEEAFKLAHIGLSHFTIMICVYPQLKSSRQTCGSYQPKPFNYILTSTPCGILQSDETDLTVTKISHESAKIFTSADYLKQFIKIYFSEIALLMNRLLNQTYFEVVSKLKITQYYNIFIVMLDLNIKVQMQQTDELTHQKQIIQYCMIIIVYILQQIDHHKRDDFPFLYIEKQ